MNIEPGASRCWWVFFSSCLCSVDLPNRNASASSTFAIIYCYRPPSFTVNAINNTLMEHLYGNKASLPKVIWVKGRVAPKVSPVRNSPPRDGLITTCLLYTSDAADE